MRILLLSIIDPVRHHGGAGAATRGLLQLLHRPPFVAEVDVVVPKSPLPHLLRQALAIVRSWLSPHPSKALFLDTRGFRRAVAGRFATGQYDLVLINGGDLLWMLPLLPEAVPKVLYAHNLEHNLFASQLSNSPGATRWLRHLLRHDLEKLASLERDGMQAVGRVLFISAADEVDVRDELPGLQTLHLPPLFDYQPTSRRPRSPSPSPAQLSFVANFAWWPNRVSLRWLLDKVLPLVARDVRLNLYGEGSERVRSSDRRVMGHGFVSDLSQVLKHTDLMLCPVLAGGGVSIKFAEALYNGVPVLATPRAARALSLPELTGIAVVDDAEGWARFLNSDDFETLAARTVPMVTSNRFAPATHAELLHAFLRL